jgi:hypothetical protein
MRLTLILFAILAAVPAFGQTAAPAQHPFGLDPYNPSAARLLRDWGGVLVQQVPLSELSKLDPFKPSDAALLRRLGEGMPLPFTGFPVQVAAGRTVVAHEPPAVRTAAASVAPPPAAPAPAAPAPAAPTAMATPARPETNDGVWVQIAGDRWLSAGRAVALDGSFTRAGDYVGFTIYRRQAANDGMIYLPTREGLVAPYRRKPQ